ncbi:MAG TPA: hypothetical protein VFG95_04275 [Nitrospiria bacterium]|nr:hypothetical protein [Nitrospiria bacterium]
MSYFHLALGSYWVVVGSVLLWGFVLERRFTGYLSHHYPGKWRALLESGRGKPQLSWPKERTTVSQFIWRSREDFGDSEIDSFRSRLRWNRRLLIGFFIVGLIGFGVYAWFFD